MKTLLLAAVALGLVMTAVQADPGPASQSEYRRPPPPRVYRGPREVAGRIVPGPPQGWPNGRPYDWCEAKAQRLNQFEYQVQRDGRVSRDEDRIARSLRADLGSNCGRGLGGSSRVWYYN